MHFDMDVDQIPRSFPAKDLGNPTPGTTYLDQPPEGSPMPPPAPSSLPATNARRAPVSQPGRKPLGGRSTMPPISMVTRMDDLCDQMRGLQTTPLSMKRQLWSEATDREKVKYL